MEGFVTFEIAKKLKEKGFRESCFGWYYQSEVCGLDYKKDIVLNRCAYRGVAYNDTLEHHNDDKHIDAPTIFQVLKWLREEKKIHIEIGFGCYGFCWDLTLNIKYVEGYNNSEWDLLDYEKYAEIDNQGNHKTYEQAALAGIEYVLDNLI